MEVAAAARVGGGGGVIVGSGEDSGGWRCGEGVDPERLDSAGENRGGGGWSRNLRGDWNCLAMRDGDLLDGAEEVFGGGMGEAIAQEVGAHGFVHGLVADEVLKGRQKSRGFAVGYSAVGIDVAELEGPAGDRIVVG